MARMSGKYVEHMKEIKYWLFGQFGIEEAFSNT